MNASFSSNALSPLDLARAGMEGMARGAESREGARGWWHAVRIVRLFGDARRVLAQCARHARFYSKSSPEKAAAYRGAMEMVARYTGESLAADAAAEGELFPGLAVASGPGFMSGCSSSSASSAARGRKGGGVDRRGGMGSPGRGGGGFRPAALVPSLLSMPGVSGRGDPFPAVSTRFIHG